MASVMVIESDGRDRDDYANGGHANGYGHDVHEIWPAQLLWFSLLSSPDRHQPLSL